MAGVEARVEGTEGESAGPRAEEPRKPEREHDQEFEATQYHDGANRQLDPEIAEDSDDGNRDEREDPPRKRNVVVGLELRLQDRAEEGEYGARDDRRVQGIAPPGQEAGSRSESPADVGEIPARRREQLGHLHQAHPERQDDKEAEEVSKRRNRAGETDDGGGEEERRDRWRDGRDVLHERAGQAERTHLQLGCCQYFTWLFDTGRTVQRRLGSHPDHAPFTGSVLVAYAFTGPRPAVALP